MNYRTKVICEIDGVIRVGLVTAVFNIEDHRGDRTEYEVNFHNTIRRMAADQVTTIVDWGDGGIAAFVRNSTDYHNAANLFRDLDPDKDVRPEAKPAEAAPAPSASAAPDPESAPL